MRLTTFEDPPRADDWDLPASDEVTMVGPVSPFRTTASAASYPNAPSAPSTPVPPQWPPLSTEPDHDEPDENDTGIMILPTDPARGHTTRNPW